MKWVPSYKFKDFRPKCLKYSVGGMCVTFIHRNGLTIPAVITHLGLQFFRAFIRRPCMKYLKEATCHIFSSERNRLCSLRMWHRVFSYPINRHSGCTFVSPSSSCMKITAASYSYMLIMSTKLNGVISKTPISEPYRHKISNHIEV